jgi:Ca2+-binding RTX toxin-like protein
VILYRSDALGQDDIYSAPVDGSQPPRNLTETDSADLDPAWEATPSAHVQGATASEGESDISIKALCAPGGRGVIRGTPGPDHLQGNAKNNIICGLGGNDVIRGRGGDDILVGGAGQDRLYGGAGDDEIFARDGYRDEIYGGPGTDTLHIDRGVDYAPHPDPTANGDHNH